MTSPLHERLLANDDEARRVLAAFGPAWLAPIRAEGRRKYEAKGVPTTRDEEFRYLPLPELTEVSWRAAYGENVERARIEGGIVGPVAGPTVVTVNGQYAPDLRTPWELPDGVFVGSLEEIEDAGAEFDLAGTLGNVNRLEGKLGTTNDERFRDLNDAHLSEAIVVHVAPGVEVGPTLVVRHLVSATEGSLVSYPRLLVVLGRGSKATLVESYEGLDGRALQIPVTEIALGDGAILSHTRLVLDGADSLHIATVAVEQGRDSVYDAIGVNLGGSRIRNDVNVFVGGEGAETRLNGVSIGRRDQILDNHTRLDHAVPNCASFEVYKSVLKDAAQGVFNGKIFVYEDAQKTDAKQTNAALLLSSRAGMNAKPQLEIFADDVKCTHGATIGQLRADALFYLRARGVPKAEAEALLVYAFAAEVLARVPDDGLRERLEGAISAALREE